MKRKKLLKTLAEFLDWKARKLREHETELAAVLEELRLKEVALDEKLQKEKGKQRQQRLHKKLDIVKAQREKGLKALEAMKSEEDRDSEEDRKDHDVEKES